MDELQFVVHQRNNQLERANKRLREALEAVGGNLASLLAYVQKYDLPERGNYLDNIRDIAQDALKRTKPGRLPKESNGEVK